MRRTRSQRAYVYFAGLMAFLMFASAVFPLIQQNSRQATQQDAVEPTTIPTATLPPPPSDLNAITFDQTYFHPSGLFTVAEPTGWIPQTPSNNGTQVQINMQSTEYSSIVEAYIDTTSIATLEDLDLYFSQAMLDAGWSSYREWKETGRELDTTNNRLQIDFELTQGTRTFLARHIAWTDGNWIYVVRVIVLPNMRDLLFYLINNLPATLKPNTLFASTAGADTTTAWTSFYNPGGNEIIRYPSNWSLADGRAGVPVSIRGLNGESLKVEVPTTASVTDEAAARAYVETLRPGVTLGTVKPITRNGGTGFTVSFTSTTLEGEGHSGLTALLNGEDNQLHVATVIVPVAGKDLNNPETATSLVETDAAGVIASFNLTTGLGLPVPTATPTPTETPTPAPTSTPAPTEALVVTEEPAVTEDMVSTEEASSTEEAATTEEPAATTEATPGS